MLVIFDCDGVLVDSELIGNAVLAKMASELGWPLSTEEATARFKGRAMPEIVETLRRRTHHPLPEDFLAAFRRKQFAALRSRLVPIPGVEDTLRALEHPFCVASNGPHEKMEVTLGAVGLLDLFEGRRFSRTDVGRAKPFPDLFLHAARSCSVEAEKCIVVEDSSLGITAARAAKMRAFGFTQTCPEAASALMEAGAELVFSDIRQLPSLLGGSGPNSKA